VADLKPDRIAEFLYLHQGDPGIHRKCLHPGPAGRCLFYKDWGAIGGTTNFLAWGEFPEGRE
jgi:[NiFe] hydrogenase large subunit